MNKKIILEITLYRLPYRLKPLFKNNIFNNNNDISNKSVNDDKKNKKKKKTEDASLFSEKTKNKPDNSDIVINIATVSTKVKTTEIENKKGIKNDQDNLISNTLNFNIPIKLKIEINRKEK